MAWTKISELTELTTPTGEEELVYAKDWQNGKIKVKNRLTKNNTETYTPTWDYNPSTKKYVDDLVWDIETLLANI